MDDSRAFDCHCCGVELRVFTVGDASMTSTLSKDIGPLSAASKIQLAWAPLAKNLICGVDGGVEGWRGGGEEGRRGG